MPETASQHQASAIDTTAHTGNSYRYIAQRIQQVTVGGRTLEIASLPSAPAETAYRDVFPPPVPTGLVSAADTAAKAIDLDWTPDVDPGLAGYIVYRRAAGTNEQPQRISPAGKPVTTSTWSDTTAIPGQRYAYSVSAIDVSGNESQRSAEVEDQWNTPCLTHSPNPQSLIRQEPHTMRYCRLQTPNGPRYAAVEDRDGAPWATALIAAAAGVTRRLRSGRSLHSRRARRRHAASARRAVEDRLRRPQLSRARRRAGQRSSRRAAALLQAAVLAARARRRHPPARAVLARRL